MEGKKLRVRLLPMKGDKRPIVRQTVSGKLSTKLGTEVGRQRAGIQVGSWLATKTLGTRLVGWLVT